MLWSDRSLLDLDISTIDLGLDILWAALVSFVVSHSASNGNAGSEDFLDSSLESCSVALDTHLLGNREDIVHFEVSVVLDILGLLSVSGRLFEGFKNKRGRVWHYGDGGFPVLASDLDLHLDSFPLLGSFHDVITDFLWLHTERGDLWSERGLGGRFSTNDFHIDERDCVWVKSSFRWHCILFYLFINNKPSIHDLEKRACERRH